MTASFNKQNDTCRTTTANDNTTTKKTDDRNLLPTPGSMKRLDKEDVAEAIKELVGVVMKPNHHPNRHSNHNNNTNTNTDGGDSTYNVNATTLGASFWTANSGDGGANEEEEVMKNHHYRHRKEPIRKKKGLPKTKMNRKQQQPVNSNTMLNLQTVVASGWVLAHDTLHDSQIQQNEQHQQQQLCHGYTQLRSWNQTARQFLALYPTPSASK